MIKKLDHRTIDQSSEIIALQKVSYQMEAVLIQYPNIPPLLETIEDIMRSKETFFGYFMNDQLVGLLSIELRTDYIDICRLAIHPDYFQRGIAQALLNYIESTYPRPKKIVVQTGKENFPAVKLYEKNGFLQVGEKEVGNQLMIVLLEKDRM